MVVFCVGVRKFWLLFVVFVSISCFKFEFLRKAIMGCMLLNVSYKTTVDAKYMTVFVYYFLHTCQDWVVCYRKWD